MDSNNIFYAKKGTREGCVQEVEGLFGALDAIQNWKNRHQSTCMDILRHLHSESCDE